MLQAKLTKYLPIALLLVFFLLTRLPYLGYDEINPDAVNWHNRSEQFIVGLKTHDWLRTYQHYHPAVTLMWIMGVPIEILKHLSPADRVYNHVNFETFHIVAKVSVVSVQLILTFIVFYLLAQIIGYNKAFFATALFTFEPFFIGNSRLLHMDILFTLFLLSALLLLYLQIDKFSYTKGIWSGLFLALAFLTKSVGISALLYALTFGAVYVYKKNSAKDALKFILSVFIPFVIFLFLIFPAMWVKPVWVFVNIFTEGYRVGVENGHGQLVFDEYTRNASVIFYPLLLLMRTSPLLLAGLVLFLFFVKKTDNKRFLLWLSIYFIGYLVVMSLPSKKVDRYTLPMYPYLAILATVGFFNLYAILNQSKKIAFKLVMFCAIAVFIAYPYIQTYPYPFLYTSPLFGSSANANKIIGQKSFGIGIHDLKTFIFSKYGYYPKIAFLDTKPMAAIYMNSRIFDARISSVNNYNILVLGINEELPSNVSESKIPFIKDASIYIYGLEYWRIYVKKAQ